ncbi:MAG TPA: hypothetical protein PL191_00155 [Candidatus Saccharimonas sp.]|nr:hypothetical protein [Candidatus Saccharibacteria bacterium]HPQ82137.1 hypothetical protein [Candidatus Saccharimonas sp.]
MKSMKKKIRRIVRRAKRIRSGGVVAVAVLLLFGAGFLIERNVVNANYTELLSTIAEGESKGNYNAYFGHAGNTTIEFTNMTIEQVLQWQREFVAGGQPSNAVGKYQFIRPTLEGLVNELGVGRDGLFDEALQDRLAIHLLERRGVREYVRGHITREQFAHNLSMEWAALPRVIGRNPGASYYDGDGLNKAQVSIDVVLAAIDSLRGTTSV